MKQILILLFFTFELYSNIITMCKLNNKFVFLEEINNTYIIYNEHFKLIGSYRRNFEPPYVYEYHFKSKNGVKMELITYLHDPKIGLNSNNAGVIELKFIYKSQEIYCETDPAI